jgi:hypothetical protein
MRQLRWAAAGAEAGVMARIQIVVLALTILIGAWALAGTKPAVNSHTRLPVAITTKAVDPWPRSMPDVCPFAGGCYRADCPSCLLLPIDEREDRANPRPSQPLRFVE